MNSAAWYHLDSVIHGKAKGNGKGGEGRGRERRGALKMAPTREGEGGGRGRSSQRRSRGTKCPQRVSSATGATRRSTWLGLTMLTSPGWRVKPAVKKEAEERGETVAPVGEVVETKGRKRRERSRSDAASGKKSGGEGEGRGEGVGMSRVWTETERKMVYSGLDEGLTELYNECNFFDVASLYSSDYVGCYRVWLALGENELAAITIPHIARGAATTSTTTIHAVATHARKPLPFPPPTTTRAGAKLSLSLSLSLSLWAGKGEREKGVSQSNEGGEEEEASKRGRGEPNLPPFGVQANARN